MEYNTLNLFNLLFGRERECRDSEEKKGKEIYYYYHHHHHTVLICFYCDSSFCFILPFCFFCRILEDSTRELSSWMKRRLYTPMSYTKPFCRFWGTQIHHLSLSQHRLPQITITHDYVGSWIQKHQQKLFSTS